MRSLSILELVQSVGESLGVSDAVSASQLLKPALRRAAHILAPAARSDLVRFVVEPLTSVGDHRESVEAALEDLIVYGDILVMRRQSLDDWDVPTEVLRPAPPTFVRLNNDEFIILGVAGDQPTALSRELDALVVDDGMVRRISSKGDDLSTHLNLLGFAQLSEQAWLRTPKVESAAALIAHWRASLDAAPQVDHAIDGLELLDGSRDPGYYRGRWTTAGTQSGVFVARRPQLYGARLWSLVLVEQGQVRRLIDIYADDDRQRPCDLAWRIQAALDAERRTPQHVRIRRETTTASIDIFSPLPAFAERHLALVATKKPGVQCLYSFVLPVARLAEEIGALRSLLWIAVEERA